jgi:hypothetical protein
MGCGPRSFNSPAKLAERDFYHSIYPYGGKPQAQIESIK